jgi:hypothetical protein
MRQIRKFVAVITMILLVGCSGEPAKPISTAPPNTVPSITPTPKPIPSSNPEMLGESSIVLAKITTGRYYFEDVMTGQVRKWNPINFVQKILSWEGDGCTLIVQLDSSIAEINLQGDRTNMIFDFEKLPKFNDAVGVPTLSPDKAWVFYMIGEGDAILGPDLTLSRYEKEHIEILSIDGLAAPFRITEHGGGWTAVWSPDSAYIAYSDYDDSGLHQLFISNREGTKRIQLTHLTMSVTITEISWSPNNEQIAAIYDIDEDNFGDATLIVDMNNPDNIIELEDALAWWWRDSKTLIAGKVGMGLTLFDLSGNILTNLQKFDYRGFLLSQFKSPKNVGFYDEQGHFSVYDTEKGKTVDFPDSTMYVEDLAYWISSPINFRGEESCQSP